MAYPYFLLMAVVVFAGPPQGIKLVRNPETETQVGQTVTIICSTETSTGVTYSWYKHGNQGWSLYQQNGVLKKNFKKDSDKYFCLASNAEGTVQSPAVTLDHFYKPKVSVAKTPEEVIQEGKTMTLTCNAQCNPGPTEYIWYKDGKNYRRQPGDVLRFLEIKESDKGKYKCKAKNSVGEDTSEEVLLDISKIDKPTKEHEVTGISNKCLTIIIVVFCVCATLTIAISIYCWRRKQSIMKRGDSAVLMMKDLEEAKAEGEKDIYATVTETAEAEQEKGLYSKLDQAKKEEDYDALKKSGAGGGDGKGVYTGLKPVAGSSDYEELKQQGAAN